MTFLSGFAEGYLTERKNRIERQQDTDDQSFQYRMKYLTEQKEKRNAKKLKETEWANQAKMLSQQMNDASFASTAYKEMAVGGVSYETMQKRIQDGVYKKNPDYVAPTRTVKMPDAVSMETVDSQFPKNERVDKRIDEIDPTLRQAPIEDNEYSELKDDASNPYVFTPKNEIELQPYEDVQYELLLAEQNKDPEAITAAKTKLRAHEIALTREAIIKARAEGKNARTYIYKDKNGRMLSTFTGEIREDGNLWNTSNLEVDGEGNSIGKIVSAEDISQVQEITPEAIEALGKLDKDFGTQSATIRDGQASYISALSTANKITKLLNRSPEVTSMTAGGVELVRDLGLEMGTAYQVVFGKENEIKQRIQSGNMNGIEKLISDYEQDVEQLIERSNQSNGIMGASNQRIASDKAIYDSLKNILAFQLAASKGLSASKMSDKDFQIQMDEIGGNKRDPHDVLRAIQNASHSVLTQIDSQAYLINSNPSIKRFKQLYGFDPDLKIQRMQDMINGMEMDDQTRAELLQTLSFVTSRNEMEKINAAEGAMRTQTPLNEDQPVGPKVGDVIDGWQFNGGDPGDEKNWKKVN